MSIKEGIAGDENYVSGLIGNDAWRTAFLRLVADVWEGEHSDIYKKNHKEVEEIFKKEYGFSEFDNLRLKITKYKGDAKYDHEVEKDATPTNGWFKVLDDKKYHATIEMMIPPKPEEKYMASALASFMAAGKAYPFTIG